jgi:hypothetical protein
MIARLPSGERIPFGPFSIQQVVAAGIMLLTLYKTMGTWAQFGLIINCVIFVSLTWGLVWLIGRIPIGSRNPISVATGVYTAVVAPASGKLDGRAVKIQRPRTVTFTAQLAVPPRTREPETAKPAGEPAPKPTPKPTTGPKNEPKQPAHTQPARAKPTQLTGLQQLLKEVS